MAAWRLRACERYLSLMMMSSPRSVTRWAALTHSRRTAAGLIGRSCRSRRSSALVARRFTFCPPGPWLDVYDIRTAEAGTFTPIARRIDPSDDAADSDMTLHRSQTA